MTRGHDRHNDPLERTVRWIQAQARQTSYDEPSPPPSPPPPRLPAKDPPSNRTTASSDQSMLHRAVPVPVLPSASPMSPVHPAHAHAQSTRGRGRGRERRDTHNSTRPPLPFPQSPPGSGYPMPLEVGPPRVSAPLQRSRSQSQSQNRDTGSIARPTYVKKRRPSLLGQLIPGPFRKREDEEK